jgi:hypothetical protein
MVIAYYTRNTPYEQEAESFADNMRKHRIPFELVGIESSGSWVENCAQKPRVIQAAMSKYPDFCIVYLDIDARCTRYPILFDTFKGDFGVFKWRNQVCSGTLFIRNNPIGRSIVDRWIGMMEGKRQLWDQVVLASIVNVTEITLLPHSYCFVHDLPMKVDAVIVHYQASRKFKKSPTLVSDDIPSMIDGFRVRILDDNSFIVIRPTKELRAKLDEKYQRIGKEDRWHRKHISLRTLSGMQNDFQGHVYIIGKGPSLDKVTAELFTDKTAPIIAINESIHKIEELNLPNPLYCFQQDAWLTTSCQPSGPAVKMLLKPELANFYPAQQCFYMDWRELGLEKASVSVLWVIKLVQKLGCKKLSMVAFDACMDGTLGYAKVIGTTPERYGSGTRFLSHRAQIDKITAGCDVEWLIPSPILLETPK